MVVARSPRSMSIRYDDIITAIDWHRTYLQATGLHMRIHPDDHETCGLCVRSVLLRTEEPCL